MTEEKKRILQNTKECFFSVICCSRYDSLPFIYYSAIRYTQIRSY